MLICHAKGKLYSVYSISFYAKFTVYRPCFFFALCNPKEKWKSIKNNVIKKFTWNKEIFIFVWFLGENDSKLIDVSLCMNFECTKHNELCFYLLFAFYFRNSDDNDDDYSHNNDDDDTTVEWGI